MLNKRLNAQSNRQRKRPEEFELTEQRLVTVLKRQMGDLDSKEQ